MRALIAWTLLSSLTLVGCAPDNRPMSAETQAGLDKALAGLTPGNPTSCMPPLISTSGTHVYGKILIYTLSGGEVYRNDTTGGCEGSGDDFLVVVEPEGRACSGDIVRTVDRSSHITTGSCALGQFVRYSKPPKHG